MTTLHLTGPPGDVAEILTVLARSARLRLVTVSPPQRTPGGMAGVDMVRAQVTAAVDGRSGPCCDRLAAQYIGEFTGPTGLVRVWSCRDCGGEWTDTTAA